MVSHHKRMRLENWSRGGWGVAREEGCSHTIDSDGNGLGEVEAVGTLEGGDLASGVDLKVLSGGSRRVGNGVHQLKLEVIVLSSDQDGKSATVFLINVREATKKKRPEHIRADRRAFRTPF